MDVVLSALQDGQLQQQTTIRFVPPPVILVHGVWSSAPQSWGSGFQNWLKGRYPHQVVNTVNYGKVGSGPDFSAYSFSYADIQNIMIDGVTNAQADGANQGIAARRVRRGGT